MIHNEPNVDKRRGTAAQEKPATVIVEVPGRNPVEFDVTDYLVSEGKVSLYLGPKSEGVDVQVALSRCVILRSDLAQDVVKSRDGEEQAYSDDPELVTDGGGVDIPGSCTVCGADMAVTAVLGTEYEYNPEAEFGPVLTVPTATCSGCRASVGATHGTQAVEALYTVRGEALPGNGDADNDDDDEAELVTDDRRGFVSGDVLLNDQTTIGDFNGGE